MTNSQAHVDKLIHAVLIVDKIVRHVPSFLKVAGGGQTHQFASISLFVSFLTLQFFKCSKKWGDQLFYI